MIINWMPQIKCLLNIVIILSKLNLQSSVGDRCVLKSYIYMRNHTYVSGPFYDEWNERDLYGAINSEKFPEGGLWWYTYKGI